MMPDGLSSPDPGRGAAMGRDAFITRGAGDRSVSSSANLDPAGGSAATSVPADLEGYPAARDRDGLAV